MIQRFMTIQSRFFHVSSHVFQSTTKSHLATLRKQTGHSVSNCKKALEQNNQDLEKAIKWLEDQAQKEGWEKAIKLQGRAVNQGLIGLHIQGKTAALIEIGCETDFVARNNYFKDLVKDVTKTCCIQLSDNLCIQNGQVIKQNITAEQLGTLSFNDNKVQDQVALAISHLGENIRLKRGLLVRSNDDISLAGAVHPEAQVTNDSTTTGTYAALIALKTESQLDPNIGHQLCMQIIGMNPQVINRPHDPKEEVAPVKIEKVLTEEGEEEEYEVVPEKNEISLMHQEFIYNPEITVKTFTEESKVEVVDFIRLECGESEKMAQV